MADATQGLTLDVFCFGIRWKETFQALVEQSAQVFSAGMKRWNRLTSVDSMGPGAIMLDVMPRGPYSIATELDRESTPALATDT